MATPIPIGRIVPQRSPTTDTGGAGAKAPTPGNRAVLPGPHRSAPRAGNTVLLVDDSRVTREVIKLFLVGRGYRIIEATDGIQALRMLHEYHPDLVLTDFDMPELDGLGLCEAISEDSRIRSTRIVVLSGSITPEQARRCRAAGAREILDKPIQPKPLLAALERHLPVRPAAPDRDAR
jgi:two-component system chemotaxis response regulator CheY